MILWAIETARVILKTYFTAGSFCHAEGLPYRYPPETLQNCNDPRQKEGRAGPSGSCRHRSGARLYKGLYMDPAGERRHDPAALPPPLYKLRRDPGPSRAKLANISATRAHHARSSQQKHTKNKIPGVYRTVYAQDVQGKYRNLSSFHCEYSAKVV